MRYVCILALVIAVVVGGCGGGGGTAAPTVDSGVALLLTPNDLNSEAWFVDNDGRIFGAVYATYGPKRLCMWRSTSASPTLLDAQIDMDAEIAHYRNFPHINDRDQFVSWDGNVTDLLTGNTASLEQVPLTQTTVQDINDVGVCVGTAFPNAGQPAPAVIWSAGGQPRRAVVLSGFQLAEANAINNSGLVAGAVWSYCVIPAMEPVIWNEDGSYVRTIRLRQEQASCGASAKMISDTGYVVVVSQDQRTYLVSPDDAVLQICSGPFASAVALNSRGQVAGWNAEGPVVFGPDGSVVELSRPSNCHDLFPRDINDDGVVVGTALSAEGIHHAVAWSVRQHEESLR